MKFLKLVRANNLLMIILVQLIISFTIKNLEIVVIYINYVQLVLLIAATTLIAASGYIINDLYDIKTDQINKPNKQLIEVTISRKSGKIIYLMLLLAGITLGVIYAFNVNFPLFILYFLISAGLLYTYARWLKALAFLGNLVVSFLVFLSVLLVPIAMLYLPLNTPKGILQISVLNILIVVSAFAFIITFIREIVKDIEDIQGDLAAGYKTAPILLGAARTGRITSVLILLFITLLFILTFLYLQSYLYIIALVIVTIIAPLGYCASLLWGDLNKNELSRVSTILKVVMFVGICLIPLWVNRLIYA